MNSALLASVAFDGTQKLNNFRNEGDVMKMGNSGSVEELESSLERLNQRERRLHGVISSPFIAIEQRLEARGELESLMVLIEEYEEDLEKLQSANVQ